MLFHIVYFSISQIESLSTLGCHLGPPRVLPQVVFDQDHELGWHGWQPWGNCVVMENSYLIKGLSFIGGTLT